MGTPSDLSFKQMSLASFIPSNHTLLEKLLHLTYILTPLIVY
ncbi:hypothetical protein ACHAWX_003192 [Stephanocyclus meneghinianus]